MRVLTHKKTAKKRNRVRHGINAERVKMHVSKGDTVRVMRGDDKGKEGKILRLYPKTGRVLVEGINIESEIHAPGRAELVDQKLGTGVAFDVLEQERGAAGLLRISGTHGRDARAYILADAVGDFGDLEDGIYFDADRFQLAGSFQSCDPGA